MGSRLLAAAAALALLPLAGCAGSSADGQDSPVSGVSIHDHDGLKGIVLPKPYDAARVSLEDTAGQPYDLATSPTKPLTLVFFGYTHCPDICQVVMANIAAGLVRLDSAQRAKVDTVFVTTDPARDTTKVLRAYVDRFDPKFDGLTGKIGAIEQAGKAFDLPVEKGHRLASGGYDITHGTNVIGLRPGGKAPYVWTQGTTPDDLADDIGAILAGKVHARMCTCARCRSRFHPEPQRRRVAPRPGSPSAATRCASSSASSLPSGWVSDASPPEAASGGRSPTSPSGRCRSGSSAAGSTT